MRLLLPIVSVVACFINLLALPRILLPIEEMSGTEASLSLVKGNTFVMLGLQKRWLLAGIEGVRDKCGDSCRDLSAHAGPVSAVHLRRETRSAAQRSEPK